MARPEKVGFDYFSLDVDYANDPNIMELTDEFGCIAELVYLKLLCIVFKQGYFIKAKVETLSNLIYWQFKGPHKPKRELILKILTRMAQYSLIDRDLLDRGVVTSKGIQKQFNMMSQRRSKKVSLFSLLSDSEMLENDIIIETKNRVIATETPVNATVSTQSKVKKRKVKENDEIKINIDKAISDLPFEIDYFTKVLISRGVVSLYDDDLYKYPILFEELRKTYKFNEIIRALRYVITYIKNPASSIDDLYAFVRHSLINNAEWLSKEDERKTYFERLEIELEEYKKTHGIQD